MKTFNIIIIAVISIFLASCTKGKQEEVKENKVEEQGNATIELTQEQIKTVGITLGKVESRSLNNVIRANGELQLNPQDMADVTSLVGGVVRKIYVTEGQQVKAGQVVAHIENTEIVAERLSHCCKRDQCNTSGVATPKYIGFTEGRSGKDLATGISSIRDGTGSPDRALQPAPSNWH